MVEAQVFTYETPDDDFSQGRKFVTLCQTDRIFCGVSLIKEGGETRLHSHSHFDGVWIVLSGRARFYGDDDVVLGEFEKYEGILVPRHFRYWFESASKDTPLELMQIEASDVARDAFFAGKSTNIVQRIDARTRSISQVLGPRDESLD